MKTFVIHLLEAMRRNGGPIKNSAQLEARVNFHPHAIVIHLLDHDLAEGLELVGEIEIAQENGELLLRATTNRQLQQHEDGEPQLQLYDAAKPYPEEDDA